MVARAERSARNANENQTLWCERVLRQETSIVHVFGKGDTELPVRYPSSSAQLPLQSRVECPDRSVRALRSPVDWSPRPVPETASRLKDLRNHRAEVETHLDWSGLYPEEFCFNGGRSRPRGRIYRVSKEEFQEKELVPSVGRASRPSGWRYD